MLRELNSTNEVGIGGRDEGAETEMHDEDDGVSSEWLTICEGAHNIETEDAPDFDFIEPHIGDDCPTSSKIKVLPNHCLIHGSQAVVRDLIVQRWC